MLFVIEFLLNQECGVEASLLSLGKIHTRHTVVVIGSSVLFKHLIELRLKLSEIVGELLSVIHWRVVLVVPRGTVRVTVAVVLVLQEFLSAVLLIIKY